MTDHTRAMLEEAWKTIWPKPSDDIGTDVWLTWFNTLTRFRRLLDAEAYLDAAVMLAGDEAFWRVGHDGAGPDPSMYKAEFIQFPIAPKSAVSPTPALALLAAIMKAKNDE